MNRLKLNENIDLYNTLISGQAFNWDYDTSNYEFTGFFINNVLTLQIDPKDIDTKTGKPILTDTFLWQTYPVNDNIKFVNELFRLNINSQTIYSSFSEKDEIIHKAILEFPKLRVLNQNFEQALLSFVLSSNNSIKAIRSRIRTLANLYGSKLSVEGRKVDLFPKAEALVELSVNELRKASLGYRAEYLKSASGFIVNNPELASQINRGLIKYPQAKSELLKIHGVGEKVADCALLYSTGNDSIVPIDLWGFRILQDYYNVMTKKYSVASQWYRDYFGKYAGWASWILFEYIRKERGFTNARVINTQ